MERENISQEGHNNPSLPARSPSVPIHGIPLILMVALAFTAATSFGMLRERFLAAASDNATTSTLSFYEINALSGERISNQPADLSQDLNLSAFTPEVQRWAVQIERWAEEYDLPAELVAIVMQIESCGDPTAVSSAGARGLFQVMPFHFGAGEDWMDTEINATRGMEYLARSYQLSNGKIDLTLAGYNGGHSVIARHPSTWPAETQRYVYWGSGIWEDLGSETVSSPTLNEWLNAGGEHLCRRAVDVSILSHSQTRYSDNGSTPIG
ncbi:MAG: lytic transglycosylase domain-containing protein [Chloroflexota bacterium]|nr:lytic transglycosylase domain-containing protein [Chloroflexota bacterium]